LTVVSREITARYTNERTDRERLGREVGASYVLELTVSAATPTVDIIARLRRPGAGVPDWEKVIKGHAVDVEKVLLDGLSGALARQGIRARSTAEKQALARLPTTHSDALMAYVEARALLDYAEIAGNTQRAVDLLQRTTLSDGQFALVHAALADALRARFAGQRDPE